MTLWWWTKLSLSFYPKPVREKGCVTSIDDAVADECERALPLLTLTRSMFFLTLRRACLAMRSVVSSVMVD